MLQDVRGCAVFRTAQQLNSMQVLSLNEAGTCAVAIVLLCTRSAVAHVHSSMTYALSTAAHSVSDIVCVASVNALLNNMISGEDLSSPLVQFLLVCIVTVMACTIQKLLSDAVEQRETDTKHWYFFIVTDKHKAYTCGIWNRYLMHMYSVSWDTILITSPSCSGINEPWSTMSILSLLYNSMLMPNRCRFWKPNAT
jgi:hypothetical protein